MEDRHPIQTLTVPAEIEAVKLMFAARSALAKRFGPGTAEIYRVLCPMCFRPLTPGMMQKQLVCRDHGTWIEEFEHVKTEKFGTIFFSYFIRPILKRRR